MQVQVEEKSKILVVEDSEAIRDGLRKVLDDHYEVLLAVDGIEGITMAIKSQPDLVLMDVMMPRLDGFMACEALRQEEMTRDIPIIMLTALQTAKERIQAFKAGADDYISKPFNGDELIARIEAKIRRFGEMRSASISLKPSFEKPLSCGNLILDKESQEARVSGKTVRLSALEFKLIAFLIENKGKLCRREDILSAVWESQDLSGRILDPHILAIRRKLEGFNHVIRAVYGGGYLLKPASSTVDADSSSLKSMASWAE